MTKFAWPGRRFLAALVMVWPFLAGGWPAAALAADESDPAEEPVAFSEAETRLWLTDQLRSITGPMELTYAFEKSGTLEPGFTDEVKLVVEKVNADGSKAVAIHFFTGERNVQVPPVESTTVNLVIGKYLEGDVYEMNRLTDPERTARERWRYFHRRIKLAFAESATVAPISFEFDGRTWQGHTITIEPYVNDPRRDLFERFADKRYSFIVSDELPGYVYRIETVIPSAADSEPLIREVLQLRNVDVAIP